jgi:CHASE2 domain-containing sensor protein
MPHDRQDAEAEPAQQVEGGAKPRRHWRAWFTPGPAQRALAGAVVLAVTAALLFGVIAAEQTALGQRFRLLAYELFLLPLSPLQRGERLPVVVVDIGAFAGDDEGRPTDRKKLRALVKEILSLPAKPSAIGIDIDYSLDPSGWMDENANMPHQTLLEELKRLSEEYGVPIYVGAHRTRFSEPKIWLGLSKFQHMATNIEVNPEDVIRMSPYRKTPGGEKMPAGPSCPGWVWRWRSSTCGIRNTAKR